MKNLISFWGEDVQSVGDLNGGDIDTKMYLSYIICREDFHFIKYIIEEDSITDDDININDAEYITMIYNQLTEQLTFKLHIYDNGEEVDEEFIETLCTRGEFFRIIASIEE